MIDSAVSPTEPRSLATYRRVKAPEHPRADPKGYVLEHLLVAERALGHFLPDAAEVHHVDEIRSHNENSNLVVCQDHAYHLLLHVRARALAVCGNANWLRCQYCNQYDAPCRLVKKGATAGRRAYAYHEDCLREYSQRSYRRRHPAPSVRIALSDDERSRILAAYTAGRSCADIACELGRGTSSVHRVLVEAGAERQRPGRRKAPP